MSETDLTIRRPRHNVIAVDQIAAWIVVDDGDLSSHVSATLIDLSRNGCRLNSTCDLKSGDKVRLVLDLPDAERQTEGLAEVRWQQRVSNGGWEYGLQFVAELEWEFLGELFLSGTLENC